MCLSICINLQNQRTHILEIFTDYKYCFREYWEICCSSYVKKTRSPRVNTSLMVMTGFSHNTDLDNYAISLNKYFSFTILQKCLNLYTKPLSHTKFYFRQSHNIYIWTMTPFRHTNIFHRLCLKNSWIACLYNTKILSHTKSYFRQSHNIYI